MTVLLAIILAAMAGTPPPKAGNPPIVAVAGLLGGTDIVPLAQFVHGAWVRTWPEPDDALDAKLRTLDQVPRRWFSGVPLPRRWFAWTEQLQAVSVDIRRPALAEAHCQTVWGLETNLAKHGHETLAFATNVKSGVHVFEESWANPQLRETLRAELDRAEMAGSPGDSIAPGQLTPSSCEPEIELWCANSGDDRSICAFSALRRRPPHAANAIPNCEDQTVLQGWVLQSEDRFKVLSSGATFTDCEAVRLRTAVPALLLEVNSRVFILVREHGYEDESFLFLELRGNTLQKVLEVGGGGC